MNHLKLFEDFNKKYKDKPTGYDIGKFLYHVTPKSYLKDILKNGIKTSKGGTTQLKKTYEPRIYLATSLIAAYDLSVNFSAHREIKHTIIKLKSNMIDAEFISDESFSHGVYIDKDIDKDAIVEIIDPDKLFNLWSDEELENLY